MNGFSLHHPRRSLTVLTLPAVLFIIITLLCSCDAAVSAGDNVTSATDTDTDTSTSTDITTEPAISGEYTIPEDTTLTEDTEESENNTAPSDAVPDERYFMGLTALSSDEYASITSSFEPGELPLTLTSGGEPLPRDKNNRFYLTVNAEQPVDAAALALSRELLPESGENPPTIYIAAPEGTDRLTDADLIGFMAENIPLRLLAADSTAAVYTEFQLVLTSVPVLTLDLDVSVGAIRDDADADGLMTLSEADAFTSAGAAVHLRGGSSRSFEKTGYKMTLSDAESGDKLNLRLLGMRSDDDWVLLPMYGDESKLRDKLSLDLWSDLGARNNTLGLHLGAQTEYVELIINGDYRGLYGLTAPVNGRSAGISKDNVKGEALYKIESWDVPEAYPGDRDDTSDEYGGVTLVSPEPSTEAWAPLDGYLDLVYNATDEEFAAGADMIDAASLIDYYIFLNVSGASDNSWKNTFIALRQTAGGLRAFFIPWDCDLSWGVTWDGDAPLLWKYEPWFFTNEIEMYVFDRLMQNVPDARRLLAERWAELRAGLLSEASLRERVDALDGYIRSSGAVERERVRWMNGGSSDNAAEYIKSYVTAKLAAADEFIRKYDY